MKKYSFCEFIKSVSIKTITCCLFLGWIPYSVFEALIEDGNFTSNIQMTAALISIIIILLITVMVEVSNLLKLLISKDYEVKEENQKLQKEYDNKRETLQKEYIACRTRLVEKYNVAMNDFEMQKDSFKQLMDDEKIYKPYLAKIISDFEFFYDNKLAYALASKKRPALKASESVKSLSKEKREINNKLKIAEYQLAVYEGLFPELEKYKEADEKDVIEYISQSFSSEDEALKKYLSIEEWNNLSQEEKCQLSLERYKNSSHKSKWQIGIDFERYVGYKYEIDGYKVVYNGANSGLEDLGRDLIAIKGNDVLIIQCKYWSEEKTIHEKHIFQLYGTTLLKQLDEPNRNVKGVFICTNKLSPLAKKVANRLEIEVKQNYKYDKDYPCIKCNISKMDGSKIYHLPFDQQYDRIDIEIDRGEKYVSTVKEAQTLGFRKAKRYISESTR